MSTPGAAVPGTVVPNASLVNPGGAQGQGGPQGPSGPSGPQGPQGPQGPTALPTGVILDFAGATAPTGFLMCDGSAVSRTTQAALYAVIGTAFGVGDGSTTFNVPDGRGRSPVGAGAGISLTSRTLGATGGEETHQLSVAELASHNHPASQAPHQHSVNIYESYLSVTAGGVAYAAFGGGYLTDVAQGAVTVSNTGSGTGHNVMHPFIAYNQIIKT